MSLWTTPAGAVAADRLSGMSIEVVPGQLLALAGVLDAAASSAARAAAATVTEPVGGSLGEALAGFCEATGTAAHCLAGELSWLGGAVAATADSWVALDGSLLPAAGQVVTG